MTVYDMADKWLMSLVAGGAYSIILGIISCGLVAFAIWKIFKKPIKRWFVAIVGEQIDVKLKGVNDRLDRHREDIDNIAQRQAEQEKQIAIMQQEHSSLNDTLKETVMPDILRIRHGVDELQRVLIKIGHK